MADNTFPQVKTTTRLWSEEVAIARAAGEGADLDPTREPGYEFSNGVKFDSGKGAAGYGDAPAT